MSIESKKEPIEAGKKEISVPKKKIAGKKAAPVKLKKVDILEGIDYSLTEVSGSNRTSSEQTHLLEIRVGSKLFKLGVCGKPTDVAIKRMADDLNKRK